MFRSKNLTKNLQKSELETFKFLKTSQKKWVSHHLVSKNSKKICFIGRFTPTYLECLKGSHENVIPTDIRLIKRNLKVNKKDKFLVYVIYGSSVTRWIRELLILFLKGYPTFYYTNYDLDKPLKIVNLLGYFPKMILTLIDVYKSWGFLNTIKRIKSKF